MNDSPDVRRLAVVTGASSGIGRELAGRAADHGYEVALVAHKNLDAYAARRPTETAVVVLEPRDAAKDRG